MPPDGLQRCVLGKLGNLLLGHPQIIRDIDKARSKVTKLDVNIGPFADGIPGLRQPI